MEAGSKPRVDRERGVGGPSRVLASSRSPTTHDIEGSTEANEDDNSLTNIE
jgi:hypothetical protein